MTTESKPLWVMGQAMREALDQQQREEQLRAILGDFQETAWHPVYGPYGWTSDGSRMNKDTHDAIVMAHYLEGEDCVWTQGGLNNGAVAKSAKTHNGLDVGDTQSRYFTVDKMKRIVARGMECGAIGFIRGIPDDNIADGMVEHIHWVRVGAQHAHPDARAQLYSPVYGYFFGGGGLGGAPGTRWWGPPRKPEVEWAQSRFNPANGWRP